MTILSSVVIQYLPISYQSCRKKISVGYDKEADEV